MSREGSTPIRTPTPTRTPRSVGPLEAAPRKTRGLGKKTLEKQAAAAADEEKIAEEQERLREVRAKLEALPPHGVEWVPRRYTHRASARAPADVFPSYVEAVNNRTVGFYKIDSRSWVAELADLQTFATASGVDAWTLLRSQVDDLGRVSYHCASCPDNVQYGTCVHKMLLEGDDVPPFQRMSVGGT